MGRKVGIKVKPTRLTPTDKTRLQKALRAIVSIMDAHDLNTVKLGRFATNVQRTK
jgi:hypothetical protein